MAAIEGGRGEARAAGELVGGSGAHRRRVSCAGEAGPQGEAPPQRRAPPPHGGVLAAALSPARQPRAPPSRPFGFELPARGEGWGLRDGGGGAGRARRAREERDKQPPTWLLPPRPPLLQYGLWRPRAAEPRKVSPGPPDTVSSSRAGLLGLLQPRVDSRTPKLGKRRRQQRWWRRQWRPSAWGPGATYLSLRHGGDSGET